MILLSFIATILGYSCVLKLFPRLGWLDFPEKYGLHRARLPYPAGIVAVIVFVVWYALSRTLGMQEIGLIVGILLLGSTSVFDDRTPLPPLVRLFIQVVVAIIIFAAGSKIYSITSPFGGIIKLDTINVFAGPLGVLPLWSGIFTVLWLLFTINALNWFDGISGQVSVIAVVGFLLLGLLSSLRNGEPIIAEISFVLAAIACAGFFFDFPPAKVVMGDTGSMFFGCMLGVLGIYSGGKVATVFLALGLPLIDALIVIFRRIARGQSPLRGGQDHLHHILLRKGWSEKKVILLTLVLGTCFGTSALFMTTVQKGIAIIVLALITIGMHAYARRPKNSLPDRDKGQA